MGTTGILLTETAAVAKHMEIAIVVREIATADDLPDAFACYGRERAKALIVQVSPLMIEHQAKIVELAARDRLPAMYEVRNFVDSGGFVSYGPDLRENYRSSALYVDRILRGATPNELPVEQPNRLALVINLKTAKALGLTIPQSLLLRADEVVR